MIDEYYMEMNGRKRKRIIEMTYSGLNSGVDYETLGYIFRLLSQEYDY